ncbi:MAG: response regulator [Verrucomicrobiota bacterium]
MAAIFQAAKAGTPFKPNHKVSMQRDYTFPETLLDHDFRDSFLGDLAIAQAQLSKALGEEVPTDTARKNAMSETLGAMHMLRGAAGAIDFTLAFDYAEMFHRIAEIGLSFAESRLSDFSKAYDYLKEAESLLLKIESETKNGAFVDLPGAFQEIATRIQNDYGDYFNNPEDLESLPPLSDTGSTKKDEDLDSFLAMIESDQHTSSTETVSESIDLGGDKPAEWDVLQYFYQEIDENLTAFEQALLALEKGDAQARIEVLRIAHSTKGAANSMGMFRIAKLMHETEALFERIEADSLELQAGDYSTILKTSDHIRNVLEETQSRVPVEGLNAALEIHLNELPKLGQSAQDAEQSSTKPKRSAKKSANENETTPTLFNDDELLVNTTSNTFRIDADKVDGLLNTVGELIISRTRLANKMDELLGLCHELSKSRNRMRDTLNAFAERFEYSRSNTRRSSQSTDDERAARTEAYDGEFTSLELDRYDEFNILSRQITEIGDDTDLAVREILKGGQDVQRESASLGSYISQIQDEIASTRLAPIVVLYKRLERAVRDAALKAEREVTLVTSGDDLLIDKSILDDLFQPMLHIVRNSVVHAFERGAKKTNTITIQARQQGGRILISVNDNGIGINFEKIKKVASSKGLLNASEATDQQLIDLIFKPGFTTTEVANEVSGRGIGLDAVRAAIESFGGSIEVKSMQDKGTTFSLHLPLTLAIDRGMYFYVGEQLYAIFMAAVEQVYFSRDLQFEQSGEKELVIIDGSSVPVIDLRQTFEQPINKNNRRESIILCRHVNARVALKVDRVYYQDDVVVKSLGSLFDNHRFFSSATIHGDGEIVPILDVSRLESSMQVMSTDVMDGLDLPTESASGQPRILVVDDSLSVRKVCEGYLSSSGYEVDTANDGLEALNMVKGQHYDLILSDLEMPRLNGLDLLSELKRRPQTSDIPVLIITSRSTAKHQEKAISLGAEQCIGKPFTREQILETLESHLLQPA